MKVLIPVAENRGLESRVHGHFGSAPMFMLVDSESMGIEIVDNRDQSHAHGACNPLEAFGDRRVDALLCGGIGARAVQRLAQNGIKVFKAGDLTVREAIGCLAAGSLPEITMEGACTQHGCH